MRPQSRDTKMLSVPSLSYATLMCVTALFPSKVKSTSQRTIASSLVSSTAPIVPFFVPYMIKGLPFLVGSF